MIYPGLDKVCSEERYNQSLTVTVPITDYLRNHPDFVDQPEDEKSVLIKRIFAPDPVTQNPRSDLAYMLKGSDDGLKEFIKTTIIGSGIQKMSGADTADEALECVKYTYEDFDEYRERLEKYISKNYENTET